MTTVSIALPQPIAEKHLFANVSEKGKVNSALYNTWTHHADALLTRQDLPCFGGPVTIEYFVGQVGVGKVDPGQIEKAYTDALARFGVILDNNKQSVRSVKTTWVKHMTGCVACVSTAFQEPSAAAVVSMVPDYDGQGALQIKGAAS